MPCYHPKKGWRASVANPKTGKRSVVFNPRYADIDFPVEVPCGQCLGCRIDRSQQWAIRCVHEASLYKHNSFITLTYDPEHLPVDGGLHIEHFQKFIKKLRKKAGSGVRYFCCGEYGENRGRPHFHVILFNYSFKDKQLHTVRRGHRLYRSDSCRAFWSDQGNVLLGNVTFQSCAYVARYIMKKVIGQPGYYSFLKSEYIGKMGPFPFTEDAYDFLRPPFITMSRRPGIGKTFFDRYGIEIYRDDLVVVDGKRMKVPRYYDSQEELFDPDKLASVKISRSVSFEKRADNNTYERLRVREQIHTKRVSKLHRSIEE